MKSFTIFATCVRRRDSDKGLITGVFPSPSFFMNANGKNNMKVKDLLKALENVDRETEVIGGAWNGRVDTYEVIDHTWYKELGCLKDDFYGTLGKMDNRLFRIESEKVFYIGSCFTIRDRNVSADKNFVWSLREVAASEKSDEEKGAELLHMLKEFAAEDYKVDKS